MATRQGWRSSFSATSALVAGLGTWFVVAIVVSQFDPGPDWLERAGYPHLDAVVIATVGAMLALVLTGFIRRHYWLRDHRGGDGQAAAISRVRRARS